jgi:integrase
MAPKTAITKRTINALKPAGERYDVFDRDLRGFSARVHPTGRITYRFKYVCAGRQRVTTIGEHGADWTPEQARAEAEILRGRVRAGADPQADREAARAAQAAARARALSVRDLIEHWLSEGRAAAPNKRESSWTNDASRLRRHIIPLLGDIAADALRRADIERAQQAIAGGATARDERTGLRGRAIVRGGEAAARGAIVSLSSCYSWAVVHDLVSSNPAKHVRKLAPNRRQRFLSEAEVARLHDALASVEADHSAPAVFITAIRLLMLTGARKSEIASLEWREVDLDRGLIRLPPLRAKTGEKVIMLNTAAVEELRRHARVAARGRYVLASPRKPDTPIVGLQKVWAHVRERAGLADVRIHDLRHTYASIAVAGGASLPIIAKALGHTQPATTQRYAHLGDQPVRDLNERIGRVIMGARNQAPVSG